MQSGAVKVLLGGETAFFARFISAQAGCGDRPMGDQKSSGHCRPQICINTLAGNS